MPRTRPARRRVDWPGPFDPHAKNVERENPARLADHGQRHDDRESSESDAWAVGRSAHRVDGDAGGNSRRRMDHGVSLAYSHDERMAAADAGGRAGPPREAVT